MSNSKKQDGEIQTKQENKTAKFIFNLLIKDLKKKELKLKPENKAPKTCQHVMVSKSALDKFYKEYGLEILHEFNSVEYIYNIKHKFYGFKSWKIFLERRD